MKSEVIAANDRLLADRQGGGGGGGELVGALSSVNR